MTALRVRLWFWQLITRLSYFSQELLFSSVGERLHEHGHIFAWPSPFNGPFFMTPPFSAVSKSCDPPSISTPSPLLISDKSLRIPFTKTKFPVTKIALQESVAQTSHFRISSTNPKVVKPFNFSKLALEAKRKGGKWFKGDTQSLNISSNSPSPTSRLQS